MTRPLMNTWISTRGVSRLGTPVYKTVYMYIIYIYLFMYVHAGSHAQHRSSQSSRLQRPPQPKPDDAQFLDLAIEAHTPKSREEGRSSSELLCKPTKSSQSQSTTERERERARERERDRETERQREREGSQPRPQNPKTRPESFM